MTTLAEPGLLAQSTRSIALYSSRSQTQKCCSWCCFVGVENEEHCSKCGVLDGLRAVLASKCASNLLRRLQQPQRAGAYDRLCAPFDLKFAKDFPIVPFYRVQGKEEPLANLLVGESLSDELKNF